MRASVAERVGRALGGRIERTMRLSGGDINDAFAAELVDGRRVFVKTNADAPADLFVAEAEGLGWLADAGAIAVPAVLAVGDDFLVLELIEPGRRRADFDEVLGRALAALHSRGASGFGHGRDNFIGRLPQDNHAETDWATFYRERRLAPMVSRAQGLLGRRLCDSFERLSARLAELVGPAEPPARLHGDLWGGNLHATAGGEPCLIDPAAYGGHREMDLAMMRLFGGFAPRVFAAYHEALPLAPGHEGRVDLYQLYPLLVHVNLFGAGYVAGVQRALERYL
ncbi:MAG: fructosamine kinase family protein [Polyangiaceae bacterium]|nr:fructosamine kinase family protein [Polyangiaceae bacterium]